MVKFINPDVPVPDLAYRASKESLIEAKVELENALMFLDNTKVSQYVGKLLEKLIGILDFYYKNDGQGE